MIVPVILCGGAGTRLWPASRQDYPKPFLPLVEGDSTFVLTLRRVADRAVFAPPVVVANVDHRFLVESALAAEETAGTMLLEPVARDTAAAIAAAAAFVAQSDPDAVMLVLPADHVIRDGAGFSAAVAAALPAAEGGRIVVFGIAPDHPATGYGYIRPGASVGGDVNAVAAFIEKPDAARAATLIAQGCVWNSGMFLLRAATALDEMRRYEPDIARAAIAAAAGATAKGNVATLARGAFEEAPKKSFDYAVMERTERAAVVAAHFDWTDLGTWAAVWDAASKDDAGNAVSGDATLVDAANVFVATDTQRVGVVGLEDVVVVAGDGAVLVAARSRSGEVKQLVSAIAARPENVFGDFIHHYRPWGNYQSLDQGPRHQVKRIVVNPGQRLSLQKHAHRAEHWTVVDGVAEITVGMDMAELKTMTVRPGEHVHIPKGAIHRMANPGATPMTLIEVQSGDYLGEDDIVRLQDDYGR